MFSEEQSRIVGVSVKTIVICILRVRKLVVLKWGFYTDPKLHYMTSAPKSASRREHQAVLARVTRSKIESPDRVGLSVIVTPG
jgi:hypothetical protein